MNADRIAGVIALAAAAVIFWLGSTAGSPEAYLFPRLIAIGMGALAAAILASSWGPAAKRRRRLIPSIPWLGLVPALAIFTAYPWALETVGFYAAGLAAFLLIVTVYAPERSSPGELFKRVAVSAAFIGALYAIFALLLNVQTPRGVLL